MKKSKVKYVPTSERLTSPKSKTVALVLCIFLGYLGIHRYYVGKVKSGILWTLTVGLCCFGWIADIILLISGGFYDADDKVLRSRKPEDELAAEKFAEEYMSADPAEIWARWKSCAHNKTQRDRMIRALDGALTPAAFSPEARAATFIGSDEGNYKTTLFECSCPDFKKRGLPCKHMYWLAQQLDLDDCRPDAADL